MRILYFSDNSSDHNRRFLEKLSFYGHEVWFLDSANDEAANDRVSRSWLPAGVRRVSHERVVRRGADPSVYEEFLPEFQSLLAKLRPELVHAGPVQGCGYVAARSGFHPLLVMSWGSDLLQDAGRNAEWAQATTTALSGADGLLCDCRRGADRCPGFRSYSRCSYCPVSLGSQERSVFFGGACARGRELACGARSVSFHLYALMGHPATASMCCSKHSGGRTARIKCCA